MRLDKIIILISLLVCALTLSAKKYGIDDIPNVQVQDRTKLLSNPDGIISPAVVSQIDSLLIDARRQTTAEIVAVVVNEIDTDDIDTYATQLINKWGVGTKDKNNGILILVSKEGRAATIRTGYGAEGIMPDILSARIIDEIMIPRFKEDDFDGGMLAGVKEVHRLVTDPVAAAELMADIQAKKDAEVKKMVNGYLGLGGIVAAALLIWLIIAYDKTSKKKGLTDYDKYQQLSKMKLPLIVCSLLFVGIPAIALIAFWLLRKYLRDHPRNCPRCGQKMQKQNEIEDNNHLTELQDLEERIKSVDYDVWLCPHCGEKDIYSFVNETSSFKECPVCHGHTMKLNGVRILREPTAKTEGKGEKIYECLHCHNTTKEEYKIEKKEPPITVVPVGGRGFRGGGGFGGGSIGGGFGGGLSGGGGATGRW